MLRTYTRNQISYISCEQESSPRNAIQVRNFPDSISNIVSFVFSFLHPSFLNHIKIWLLISVTSSQTLPELYASVLAFFLWESFSPKLFFISHVCGCAVPYASSITWTKIIIICPLVFIKLIGSCDNRIT